MQKIHFYIITLLLSIFCFSAYSQNQIISGRIIENGGDPIRGASISAHDSHINNSTITDSLGHFSISITQDVRWLKVSCVGYGTEIINASKAQQPLRIILSKSNTTLEDVFISTGYQTLPKERATGSFVSIDNKLLNRSVSTNILSRLENVASGLQFDNRFDGDPLLSIRGISTIDSDPAPLIIVDNFPYEGDIKNINPNDIENISLLKDAAASSIWGARAGNGVIVITTKKGNLNQSLNVEINSNITIGQRPDLGYNRNFLNSSDFIEVERFLFNQGFYNSMERSSRYPALSPVVELLIAKREGKLSQEDLERQIDDYKNTDLRNDLKNYLYRNTLKQQFSLNIRGGGERISYFMGAGFDKNNNEQIENGTNRTTLNSLVNFHPIKNMEISSNIFYSIANEAYNTTVLNSLYGSNVKMYPYAKLSDENSKSLQVIKDYNFDFAENAENKGLLNWQFYPLNELANTDNNRKTQSVRINNLLKYTIIPSLNIEGRYQYEAQTVDYKDYQNIDLYRTRNTINQYAYLNDDGVYTFPVPKGDILDFSNQDLTSHGGRAQVNFNKYLNNVHQINALVGMEVRQTKITGNSNRIYGYDDNTLTHINVDNLTRFLSTPSGSRLTIPTGVSLTDRIDRNVSYYTNFSYMYSDRYLLSGSIRKDESNLFGVDANQKGVPLWSSGIGWIINNEHFYNSNSLLPLLKIRASYGYSGIVNKRYTAYTTGIYRNDNLASDYPYIQLMTPPNPQLRWERINTANLGVDFAFINNIVSGSVEFYKKDARDLIGTAPLAPSTGFSLSGRSEFIGNNASMSSKGIDIQININNRLGNVLWNTELLYNFNSDKIIKYDHSSSITSFFLSYPPPVAGNPRFSVYSLPWGGLDPETGDPTIIFNGHNESNYNVLFSTIKDKDLIYNGPGLPTQFGSVRNNFIWNNLTMGFNISYKLGYVFRKSSVNYSGLFNNWIGHVDYSKRWQQLGDEKITDIPSMPSKAVSSNRDLMYTMSSTLIEKGDHIRLKDVNISYEFSQEQYTSLPFSKISAYVYINNIGFIWRANKAGLDPEYLSALYPPIRSYSLGLRFTL